MLGAIAPGASTKGTARRCGARLRGVCTEGSTMGHHGSPLRGVAVLPHPPRCPLPQSPQPGAAGPAQVRRKAASSKALTRIPASPFATCTRPQARFQTRCTVPPGWVNDLWGASVTFCVCHRPALPTLAISSRPCASTDYGPGITMSCSCPIIAPSAGSTMKSISIAPAFSKVSVTGSMSPSAKRPVRPMNMM